MSRAAYRRTESILRMVKNKSVGDYLLMQHDDFGRTWENIADEYEVSVAMAWRVAKQGYEPKDAEIRKKLGFPEIIQLKVHRNKEGRFSKG